MKSKAVSKKVVAYPTLVGGIGALLEQSRRAVEIFPTVSGESLATLSRKYLVVKEADIFQPVSEKSATVSRKTNLLKMASVGHEERTELLRA